MHTSSIAHQRSFVRRVPIYYGWVIWLVATIGMSATMPGQTPGVSLFIDRYIADFGLTNRSTIATLYGVGTFAASLLLPFVGNRLDKYGSRVVGVVICILFAFALVYMALVNNLAMLLVGFFLIRVLGQGSLALVNMTVLSHWFKRYRGRVVAFSFLGFGLFQRWYIPFVRELLEQYSFRMVWIMLAGGILLIVIPVFALFMREVPERFGLLPDGDAAPTEEEINALENSDVDDYTLQEAMRLPIFWVFLIGGMMGPAFITGIVFHHETLFSAGGYDAATAARAIASGALVGSVMTLITGWLVDRIRPGIVRALELSALVGLICLSAFFNPSIPWLVHLFGPLYGIVNGVGSVFNGAVWANLFGRKHQGEIRGFVFTALVTGTALGPVALSISYDLVGNYQPSLWIGAVLVTLPMILTLFMNVPRPRVTHSARIEATSS